MTRPVWFWQRMLSVHMGGLASALALRGIPVSFVVETGTAADRASLGWRDPEMEGVNVVFVSSVADLKAQIASAPPNSIHICQGLRANGLVGRAQAMLADRALEQWVVMESVDDSGWKGAIRRPLYRSIIGRRRDQVAGILATGAGTARWLVARGAPAEKVYPFTYFLPQTPPNDSEALVDRSDFRFIFVGQFIRRKRLDLLLEALANLGRTDVSLTVVGGGALEEALRSQSFNLLGSKVQWLGVRPQSEIPKIIAACDCLVLPSRFDGWGAVASEALMCGTPVICSDRCGCSEVVRLSAGGEVFRANDAADLAACLSRVIDAGHATVSKRRSLADWAACVAASTGAEYLEAILSRAHSSPKPTPPWLAAANNTPTGEA